MPQNPLPFKVSAAKRLIGAVQKKGLLVKSIMAAPDGTLTISIAAPSDQQIENHDNEWDRDYGAPAA